MPNQLQLTRVAGIPIRVDASWVPIALLIAWSLSGVFAGEFPEGARWEHWTMGLVAALGFFASIVAHEIAHALVGRRSGVVTSSITLFVFGGVATIEEEPKSPGAEAAMALAGPLFSLALGAVLFGAAQLANEASATASSVVGWIALLNGSLALFNLVPAHPLDGGRVLHAILWKVRRDRAWATRVTAALGRIFGAGLIFTGILELVNGDVVNGLWLGVLGLFLRSIARRSVEELDLLAALEGAPLSRIASVDIVTVPPSMSIAAFVDEVLLRHHYKSFPVTDEGKLIGTIGLHEVQALPRARWPVTSIGDACVELPDDATIDADATAIDAFRRMRRTKRSRLYVVEADRRLFGIVSAHDLLFIADTRRRIGLLRASAPASRAA